MIKGISRQVIVVRPSEQKLFEQAIFILNDRRVGQGGVSDAELLKEANRLLGESQKRGSRKGTLNGLAWACGGALGTAAVWLLTALI